jgi:acetyl-CoA decarbonylase/synthase complex subunit gamma
VALKALDVYKLLPKKNCKECGYPTCLAFAMKIAAGKADVADCPYIDEATKRQLGAATRPPIRLVKIGVGERRVLIGDETVMFRHEKTFYHQPGIFVRIPDTWPAEQIAAVAGRVEQEIFTRVGQDLFLTGVAVANDSGSPETFGAALATVEEAASIPEVLMSGNPAAQERALAACGNYRPLIYGATDANYKEFCALAKKFGCPVGVRARGIEALAGLTTKCVADGVEDLVIDPLPATLREYLTTATAIRRAALRRTIPEVGYPIFLDTAAIGLEDAGNALGVLKYAAGIVTALLPHPQKPELLTVRQNVYTDPQKPIQVQPGLYRINNPGPDAPVLLTVNFSLTYFTVLGYLEGAKIPCHLLIVDTEGLSVLTAVAAGKLNEVVVKDALAKFGVADVVTHRTLVIPGYAAPISGRVQEETGWTVKVGPRDAAEIAEFLEKGETR